MEFFGKKKKKLEIVFCFSFSSFCDDINSFSCGFHLFKGIIFIKVFSTFPSCSY